MENKGVIYVLTNPSFPQYVKIGYATDVKQRHWAALHHQTVYGRNGYRDGAGWWVAAE